MEVLTWEADQTLIETYLLQGLHWKFKANTECVQNPIQGQVITAPKVLFRKVLFCAVSVFFLLFFKMFEGALSLEWLDRSQPNFHTRWMGGLAQTLLKIAVIAWAVGSHLGKTLFSHNYDCSGSTDCTGVAFTSPQASSIHCLQGIDFICLKIRWYTHAPGGLILSSSSIEFNLSLLISSAFQS